MNLTKLFEMQKVLDAKIVKQKGLEGVDLLDKKNLALLTELGELANEARFFKFWSENQKPRTNLYVWIDELGNKNESGLDPRNLVANFKCRSFHVSNPLLEEYVDNIHFALGIGNDLEYNPSEVKYYVSSDVTNQFKDVFHSVIRINKHVGPGEYEYMLGTLFGLGEMLGFTWDQIEQAYMNKNEENHARQANGY